MLTFKEENLIEDWIVRKGKIQFEMDKDKVNGGVYNTMKQTGRKNTFIEKHPVGKLVTLFLKYHSRLSM